MKNWLPCSRGRCSGRARRRKTAPLRLTARPSRSATFGAIPIAVGPSFPSSSFLPRCLTRALVGPIVDRMIKLSAARSPLDLAPQVCAIRGSSAADRGYAFWFSAAMPLSLAQGESATARTPRALKSSTPPAVITRARPSGGGSLPGPSIRRKAEPAALR